MVTVLAGIASAKIAAALLGPAGVGTVSLVQGVSASVAAVIELGLATAIIRAHSAGRAWDVTLSQLVRVARHAVLIGGFAAVVLAAVLAPFVSEAVFADPDRATAFVLAAATGIPVALLALENGTMIAAHRVTSVARIAVATAFVSPSVNLVWYRVKGEAGVAPGAFTSAVIVLAVAYSIRRWEFRRRPEPALAVRSDGTTPDRAEVRRGLLADGLPVMVSALVGAAALLVLPIVVGGELGRDEVGFYRAANVISIGYTAALSLVIGADFLPRVGKVASSPAATRKLVLDQVALLTAALVPLLSLVAAFLPTAVTILYREDFAPTVDILEWQLPGDLFRVIASVLATALFARFGGTRRLLSELFGLTLLVGLSIFGLAVSGIPGLGWGFLATYVVYLAMLIAALGFSLRDPSTVRGLTRLGLGAFAVGIPSILVHATGASWTRLSGVLIAVAWSAPAARRFVRARRAPAASKLISS